MDLISAVLVVFLGAVAAILATRRLRSWERTYARVSFGAHVAASLLHWAVTEIFYGVSDAHEYRYYGIQLAKLLDFDLVRFAPEVLKLALHMDTSLPFEAAGAGSSTGTMSALGGVVIFVTGSSLLTMYLMVSCFSWFGQLCLYRVARQELDRGDRVAACVAFFFVPSVIFWGSGFLKEAFSFGFLGVLSYSTYTLLRHRRWASALGIVVGGVGVAILKSFTLFAFVLSVATFIYTDRAWRHGQPLRVRPVSLIVAAGVAIGGILAMGSLFPEYSAHNVAETIAMQQAGGRSVAAQGIGGSNIEVGNEEATTLTEQLAFVPIAALNTFFRPAIFEAKNAPMLGAALENTLLVLGLLSLLRGGARRPVVAAVFRTPLIAFSLVFCLTFGTAVGLATSNLGTLSRYRMPIMPFYALSVLLLRRRARESIAGTPVRASVFNPRRPRAV